MPVVPVSIKKLHPDAIMPVYKKKGDAGFDLHTIEDVEVPPRGTAILPTGLAFAMPEGFEMQIRMRSGAAFKTPLFIPNAPGTIDSGYRGEVGIIVRNASSAPFMVRKGERIAQGVIAPVYLAEFSEAAFLPDSERGAAGFGSTGASS